MPTLTTINIITPDSSGTVKYDLDYYLDAAKNGDDSVAINALQNYLKAVDDQTIRALIVARKADGLMGSGSFAVVSKPTEGDKILVGTTGITGSTTSTYVTASTKFFIDNLSQVNTARNIADAINAQSANNVTSVVALPSGTSVYVYSVNSSPNDVGVTLSATAGGRITASGSAGAASSITLTSGTYASRVSFKQGWYGVPQSGNANTTS